MQEQLLHFDEKALVAHFPRRHFRLRHDLSEHPLFQLDRLIQLAETLPPQCVEYNAAYAEVSQDPRHTPHTGLGLIETLQSIGSSESWVVLKYVEIDPDYRKILQHSIEELSALCSPAVGEIGQLESYIFISSPGAVTPLHFDDEHNFLLQIAGTKVVHTWNLNSPGAASCEEIEAYYAGAHRNIPVRPAAKTPDHDFALQAGEGLHIPVHSPHWVKNGPQVSISFSVTFRSAKLQKEVVLHRMNARLRRFGLAPKAPGVSQWRDNTKYTVARTVSKSGRLAKRLLPQRC